MRTADALKSKDYLTTLGPLRKGKDACESLFSDVYVHA